MQIVSHPATRGYYWLTEGLRIFRLQPLGLLAITFLALVIMSLPLVLPGVGFLLAVAIVPVLYVGLMHAIRQADQGQLPNPAMLFHVFQGANSRTWQSLLVLGGVSAALTVLALGVTTVLGGSTMIDMSVTEPDSEAMRDPMSVLGPILVFFACYTPVQMALWFSPMFVAWHQVPVGKALFFSIVAVWRNKGAFAVLLGGWVALLFVAIFILRLLVMALGLSTGLVSVMVSPLSLLAITGMYCSFWVTYRDSVISV